MLGAIAGDVIGSVYEFNNTKDYNFDLFNSESGFTDDSVMTIAVAQWLMTDKRHRQTSLEKIMVDFAGEVPCPMGGYGSMFYRWLFCPESLQAEGYPQDGKRHPYGSWGNGSAMRCSAVGWAFDSLEKTEEVAELSAAITHNHPEGIKGARATAAAIYLARTGKSKEEIKDFIRKAYGYDLERNYEELKLRYGWDSSCQGTVPEAIIAFLSSSDFEDAIRRAVSLGGDSDTLTCITGGIAEAYYGGVPADIRAEVLSRLDSHFLKVLDMFSDRYNYKY